MLRFKTAARMTVFCLTIFISLGQSNSVVAQGSYAAPYEKKIEEMNSSGSEIDSEQKVQTYGMAATLHVADGNLEKANERIQQALEMCRGQNFRTATPFTLHTAVMIVKQSDPDGAEKFLKGQLNHPDANAAFKKAVYKELSLERQVSGAFVSSIASSKDALEAVQKEAPGSIEEAEALFDYGNKCLTAKFIDLGIQPLQRCRTLAAKLNRYDISNRAASSVATGLLSINKAKEAGEILTEQIKSNGDSQMKSSPAELQNTLSRIQTMLGEFDAADKTIEDIGREWVDQFGTLPGHALSLKASNLFARSVAEGSLEATMPVVIKTLEAAIEDRLKTMKIQQAMVKGDTKSVYKMYTDLANSPDYLALAAFEFIAGMDDAALKSLDRSSLTIDSTEDFYEKFKSPNAASNDTGKVIIADRRAAIAEIRQMILVRNERFEDALVIAEQSRGEAQSDLLKRRLGIETKTDDTNSIDIKQIQSIADSQKTTLVYFSLIHALDPATRGFFQENHTVNSVQELYIWVVRPQQEIEFHSQMLSVDIDDLVSLAREEIFAFMGEPGDQQAVSDIQNEVVTDVEVLRLLTRSAQPVSEVAETETAGSALQKLHQLLIEPIKKWLPTSADEIVTFVPQGNLFVVPFAALSDRDDEPLLKRHTIAISPSARLLALAEQEFRAVKRKDNQGVLIVGNPTMPSYQVRPHEPAVRLPPLPGTEAEADYIADLFGVKPLKGDAADERSVVEAMESARYIHLATHGILKADNSYVQSYLSSLALAPSEGEDGFLTVRETMELKLNAELAVLSGCDTGRGQITGDGVVGLSRGYISSGVPTVVVSLWPVSDNSTAVLMAMYYKELLGGAGKAAALRTAMLKTREQFAQPYAWAAFTLYGYSR